MGLGGSPPSGLVCTSTYITDPDAPPVIFGVASGAVGVGASSGPV